MVNLYLIEFCKREDNKNIVINSTVINAQDDNAATEKAQKLVDETEHAESYNLWRQV